MVRLAMFNDDVLYETFFTQLSFKSAKVAMIYGNFFFFFLAAVLFFSPRRVQSLHHFGVVSFCEVSEVEASM